MARAVEKMLVRGKSAGAGVKDGGRGGKGCGGLGGKELGKVENWWLRWKRWWWRGKMLWCWWERWWRSGSGAVGDEIGGGGGERCGVRVFNNFKLVFKNVSPPAQKNFMSEVCPICQKGAAD